MDSVRRREVLIGAIEFERQQIADRRDLSEVEKQQKIADLVRAQRAIVEDIVRSHHGAIEVRSAEGRGTAVLLRWPLAAQEAVAPTARSQSET